MAEKLYPVADVYSTPPDGLIVIGAATVSQALDADSTSYVNASGQAYLEVELADPTMTDDQLVSVTVEFDCRPQPTFVANIQHQVFGELYHPDTGYIYALSVWTYTGSTSFQPATVNYGSVCRRSVANVLRLRLHMPPRGLYSERWEANDAHMVATALFNGATTTVTGPTGVISDSTPTIQYTVTVDDPATEVDFFARARVFSLAQYSAVGFDPATSPATWDSGLRYSPPLHAIATTPLPPDTYRAYVSATEVVNPGPPWTQTTNVPLPGPYAFTAFQIVGAAPAIVGPTIQLDAVRDLTAAQRATLTEAYKPQIRVSLYTADGVYVRDLNVVGGSVVLDAAAQIRGTASFTCTDLDIVPASAKDASGVYLPLHPFGSYVHISSGVGTTRFGRVMVGVGVFRITNVKRDRDAGLVTVKAKDFAVNLLESRFAYPVTRQSWDTVPPTPFTVLGVAQQIIAEAGLAYRTPTFSGVSVVLNYRNEKGDERPKAMDGLAATIDGWVWYFDIDGVGYFGPGPDLTSDAVSYTFQPVDALTGQVVAQIIGREQELSRDNVYDVAVASDQANTIIGGAYDAAADSIIARSAADPAQLIVGAGPFSPGGKPYFYSSPSVTTLAGAQAAARTRLGSVALPAEGITATCVPLPDLRPDKMIAMARDGGTEMLKWQVVKVTLPLSVGPMMTFDALTRAEAVDPAS